MTLYDKHRDRFILLAIRILIALALVLSFITLYHNRGIRYGVL